MAPGHSAGSLGERGATVGSELCQPPPPPALWSTRLLSQAGKLPSHRGARGPEAASQSSRERPSGPSGTAGMLGSAGLVGGVSAPPPAGPALPTAAQRLPQLAPAAPSPPGQAGPALATPRAPGGDPRWASQLLPGQRSSGEPPGRECGLVGVT